MDQFKIKFRGLKEGTYNFKFNINETFFKKYPESEIKEAKVLAEVEMLITKDLLRFNIYLSGKAELQCDRCLDFFNSPINYETVLFADFGDNNSDLSDADNRITISNKASEIVLDKHIYDYLHLSLPYKKIHPKDKNGKSTCNKEMIKKIEEYSTYEETEITDPRWDKLKSLYN
ncbi:MAG: DUF177 domain-containing protein [Chlorobi bacterium]|nr:DUF177 domain-containing protein [Chlorobiota bacterium]